MIFQLNEFSAPHQYNITTVLTMIKVTYTQSIRYANNKEKRLDKNVNSVG